jgi:hypothetical protein
MVSRPVVVILTSLAVVLALGAGTPGIFQGRIYEGRDATPGWIYVQGRNGMLRKVEISRARVIYAASVPSSNRAKDPKQDLAQGAEVRITAEQDGDGEWRASQVEILQIQSKSPAPQNRAQAGSKRVL